VDSISIFPGRVDGSAFATSETFLHVVHPIARNAAVIAIDMRMSIFPVECGVSLHHTTTNAMTPLRSAKVASAIEARISAVLLDLQPLLRIEHCRIDLIEFSPESGALTLRIGGECPDCEMSPATFAPAIAAHVKQRVPEVREVRLSA